MRLQDGYKKTPTWGARFRYHSNSNVKQKIYMGLNLKGLFSGGLKGLGDTAKNIIAQVAENKMTVAEADILLEKELNRHAEAMEASALKEMELQNANTGDARKAEVERMKIMGRADYFQYLIGLIPVLGLPALVYYVMMYEIPQRNEHLAMLIIGEVLGFVASIYNYHYGSSMGSRIKDMRK
jgi:hypothetical protein